MPLCASVSWRHLRRPRWVFIALSDSADFSSPFHGGCGKTRGEMGPDGMLRWKPQADSVLTTETIHPSQPQVGHEHSHGGHGGHGHGHELWGKPTVVILRLFFGAVEWVSTVFVWCFIVVKLVSLCSCYWFWFLVCFNWYRPCCLNCFVFEWCSIYCSYCCLIMFWMYVSPFMGPINVYSHVLASLMGKARFWTLGPWDQYY